MLHFISRRAFETHRSSFNLKKNTSVKVLPILLKDQRSMLDVDVAGTLPIAEFTRAARVRPQARSRRQWCRPASHIGAAPSASHARTSLCNWRQHAPAGRCCQGSLLTMLRRPLAAAIKDIGRFADSTSRMTLISRIYRCSSYRTC